MNLYSTLFHVPVRALAFYLFPPALGAIVLWRIARGNAMFALLSLPATLAHEWLHFFAGFVAGARPVSLSVWPRRAADGSYMFGEVVCENMRWWNAAPASLAPMLGYVIAAGIALFRLRDGFVFSPWDAVLWVALAQLLFASSPSKVDWRLSLKSWPLFVAAAVAIWLYRTGTLAAV